jgi:hypothetical protein
VDLIATSSSAHHRTFLRVAVIKTLLFDRFKSSQIDASSERGLGWILTSVSNEISSLLSIESLLWTLSFKLASTEIPAVKKSFLVVRKSCNSHLNLLIRH